MKTEGFFYLFIIRSFWKRLYNPILDYLHSHQRFFHNTKHLFLRKFTKTNIVNLKTKRSILIHNEFFFHNLCSSKSNIIEYIPLILREWHFILRFSKNTVIFLFISQAQKRKYFLQCYLKKVFKWVLIYIFSVNILIGKTMLIKSSLLETLTLIRSWGVLMGYTILSLVPH